MKGVTRFSIMAGSFLRWCGCVPRGAVRPDGAEGRAADAEELLVAARRIGGGSLAATALLASRRSGWRIGRGRRRPARLETAKITGVVARGDLRDGRWTPL